MNGINQEGENLSDEKLVRLFVENQDEGAFNELVGRYGDKIYRIGLGITNNPTDAEEVLQEVFLTLVRKLDTFREDSKFSTWLHRVAVNESYSRFRKDKKRENHMSLEDYVPYNREGVLQGVKGNGWGDIPDDVIASKEYLEIIERAVEELPTPYRLVFVLKDIEGSSVAEVAEVLKLSVPAVKSRLHRARLFLRDRLSDLLFQFKEYANA